jgi:FkbM family methyltransferase
MRSRLRSRITDGILKLGDYSHYSALALNSGVPLHRLNTLRHAANLIAALPQLDLQGNTRIVDVGAHCGEWAVCCARLFPHGKIISFEPVTEYYEAAQRLASRFSNWKVMPLALGDQPGELPINVQGQRSSFRPLSGEEFEEWRKGNGRFQHRETVRVETLDHSLLAEDFLPLDLLKIDAEGYEIEILRGAEATLRQTKQVLIEVRFYPLFQSGSLFADVHQVLNDAAFELAHLKPCKGQCLWADALYVKKAGPSKIG